MTALLIGGANAAVASEVPGDPESALLNLAEVTSDEDTNVLSTSVDVEPDDTGNNALDLSVEGSEIVVPNAPEDPVEVGSVEDEDAVSIYRPFNGSFDTKPIANGVVANEGDLFTTVTSVKEDGGLQMATIIHESKSPERFEYQLDIPDDATTREDHGGVFIEDKDGKLIGGFTPPWAKDANGVDVPTHYVVEGNRLVQVVDHQEAKNIAYPIVADPIYRKGIIKKVVHERWKNGGWEIRFTVTALAYWYQPFNPGYVYKMGLDDLREHHPRSMAKATMAQQWDCHVRGLHGVINVDLESKRKSWPGWRKGIIPAVLKANAPKACNW